MLAGKSAIVTGGSSGIGKGIALTLADAGADVVIADIRKEPREGGDSTVSEIESKTDSSAEYIHCDVSEPDDIQSVVDAVSERGGLDIMVNNAAVARANDVYVDEEEYEQIMDVNVKGVFFGTRIAGEEMADSGGGSIVNIASPEGIHGVAERPVYSSSRGAVTLITESFAGHYGPDAVRVNTVHPGLVETKMVTDDIPLVGSKWEEPILQQTPLRRLGEAKEIGNVVAFLSSDLASYVTAAEIVVDGGQSSTM